MYKQKGQVILILLLVMSVALGVGLSIVQRSLSDVSSSTKVEQSQRAFSAAEAGIERALRGGTTNFQLDNSSVSVDVRPNLPNPGQALECPPLSKEEITQVWLANPQNLNPFYTGSTIDVFWGEPGVTGADKPALEITIIYQNSAGSYVSKKYFYDQDAATRNNGFTSSITRCPSESITTSLFPNGKTFLCQQRIDLSASALPGLSKLILLRARPLYSSISQSFAAQPASGQSLPPQARLIKSTGSVGQTQRKIQLCQIDKVTPFYFDYAIFSAAEISK